MQLKFLPAMLIAVACLFPACQKEETPKPKTEDPLGEFNRELIIGKWEAVRLNIRSYSHGTLYATDTYIKDTGYVSKEGKIIDAWSPDMVSMITFTANNKFSHAKPDGTPDSYMLADILPANGDWNLNNDLFTLTTVYDEGNKEVPWSSVYTKDNGGKYIIGLSKAIEDTIGGSSVIHLYDIVIKKQ